MGGVEGFVITDAEGVILRQSKAFSDELAQSYAAEVVKLARRARHVVRDLDPKVRGPAARPLRGAAHPTPCPLSRLFAHPSPAHSQPSQTDLEFFRMRMRNNREILAAPGKGFLVVVVQHWQAAPAVPV